MRLALLRVDTLDWVPEDHVVRLVIGTVGAVVTPALTAGPRSGGPGRRGTDFPGSHKPEQPRVRKFMPMGFFNADGMMFSLAGWRLVVDEGETS